MKNKNIFLIMARSGSEYLARQNLRLVNDVDDDIPLKWSDLGINEK